MTIYYLKYKIIPTKQHENYGLFVGGYAYCWIKASSPDEAAKKAEAYIIKYHWSIEALVQDVVEPTAQDYLDRPEGSMCYHQAEKLGLAVAFGGFAAKGDGADIVCH